MGIQDLTVFVDYQNVHISGHETFCGYYDEVKDCLIDPVGLADLLAQRRKYESRVAEIHVYRGRPDPRKEAVLAGANDRQRQKWERDSRVSVHARQLRYPNDWPTWPAREKGVDVQLAVDVIRKGMLGEFDAAIVVSRDTDLEPALQAVRDLGGPHIEVATWDGASRIQLDSKQPLFCHKLDRAAWEAVRDRGFYGPRGPYQGPRPAVR